MFKTAFKVIGIISDWLERCRIRVYAAQASFFTVISAIPFLILLLSILGKVIPVSGGKIEERLLSEFSSVYNEAIVNILSEIKQKSNISLISISAITLFWSSSRGVRGIGEGVRNVMSGKRDKGIFRPLIKSLAFTMLYMLSILTALLIWVFGDTIKGAASEIGIAWLASAINGAALLIVLTAVFALTYRGYAGKKIDFFKCLPGALLSAAGWFLYSLFFEFYLHNFANYSYVYGSIASIIVLMLWLYSCFEILLIGAGISSVITAGSSGSESIRTQKSLKTTTKG